MSRRFFQAFSTRITSPSDSCACGKFHFDIANIHEWGAGELEDLKAKAEADPEHYMAHDYAIQRVDILGQLVVYGCDCGIAQKYEHFIKGCSEEIAKYLRDWRAEELRHAEAIAVPDELAE